MPAIEFMENPIGPGKVVDAPQGGELVDICDDAFAPVPFSCRSATCGTCQVRIVEGGELLDVPDEEEAELLELLGGPADSRLACQAHVRAGCGRIRLKPVSE